MCGGGVPTCRRGVCVEVVSPPVGEVCVCVEVVSPPVGEVCVCVEVMSPPVGEVCVWRWCPHL